MHAQLITLYIILHRNAHTPRQHSMATPGMDLVGGGASPRTMSPSSSKMNKTSQEPTGNLCKNFWLLIVTSLLQPKSVNNVCKRFQLVGYLISEAPPGPRPSPGLHSCTPMKTCP